MPEDLGTKNGLHYLTPISLEYTFTHSSLETTDSKIVFAPHFRSNETVKSFRFQQHTKMFHLLLPVCALLGN